MSDAPKPETAEARGQEPSVGNPEPPTLGDRDEAAAQRVRGVGLWAALAALILFSGIQGAGLLLRDRVEGRLARLEAPPETGEGPTGVASTGGNAQRFGPQVREVTVASTTEDTPPPPEPRVEPSAPPPPAPEYVPETPLPPPASAGKESKAAAVTGTAEPPPEPPSPAESASPVAAAAAPAPEPPRPEPQVAAPAAAPSTATHVLQMGVFRSQVYRREVEEQLDRLGVPHYREEGSTEGTGYRVAISARTPEDREKARGVLAEHGYAFREKGGAIETVLYLEGEAQRVLSLLTRSGLAGGYGRVEGEVPRWTVFAGPFGLEEAKAVRDRLNQQGLQTFLRKRP